MAKSSKKDIINQLHSMITKEAALAQTDISGKPGVDTKITSISESTETTDQNSVGPEKLNDKQKYEQKPATDESVPVANVKTSSENIDKVAADILNTINAKLAEAQTNISGKPGKDTKITSVSDSTETTDQNAVGPDKLNGEQEYDQKPSSDPSAPVKAKKAADASVKQASYNLGAQFADTLTKRASAIRENAARVEMMKEAGRRDFETLIENAANQLKLAERNEQFNLAKAAELGARAFEDLYKQAQFDAVVEQCNSLKAKVAQYESFEKEASARLAEQREVEAFSKIASMVTEKLKDELLKQPISSK